ncbi:hypothetical protein AB2L28_00200 [Kineococcus sp. TBRC 1896]|uniref:Core-2/I-Branching enzyme n=1 Tax=Kineococcus mangrovi TaxID=1660183 RepID=A0ABV4HW55_9ACTN
MTTTPRDLRLAYLVSSYRSGGQLTRLLTTLRRNDPAAEIVLLHNGFENPIDPAVVEAVGGHLHLTSVPVVWGDMSLELERHRVLRWVLGELDVDWVLTLSEQDYPLAPAAALRDRLGGTSADAVLDVQPVARTSEPAVAQDVRRRYGFRYATLPSWPGGRRSPRVLRRAAEVLALVLERSQPFVRLYLMPTGTGLPPKVGRRASLPVAGYELWWGSAWFALSRRALTAFVDRLGTAEGEALVEFFARTVIPTEAFTPTLLAGEPGLVVERDALHEIRFSDPGSGRPDEFGAADLEHLLASGRFMARKFAPGDPALDALDAVTAPAR